MTPQEKSELELPVPEDVAIPSVLDEREKRRFPESLIIVAKHKFFIVCFVAGVAVLSAVVSMFLTKIYTANARILPPQQSQSIASAMLSQLGPLAPMLMGGAGGALGMHNPNDMYVAMLRSRTVADDLIDRFDLMNVYRQKLRVEARKRLAVATEITAGLKDNIISISVEDPDAQRSSNLANGYVEELEKLTKTLSVTDAGKRRLFFEREAKSANDELANAEQELKLTEEKTGIIQLDNQSRVMLQAYADLRAQVTVKEVQVQAMRSFATPENPDLLRSESELAALRTQLARMEQGARSGAVVPLEKVPGVALEYVRKFREVKYREALLELMLKQYEIARIDESKDSSIIQVLDKALPPEKRSWPPRTVLVMVCTFLALMVAISAVLVREKAQRTMEEPQFAAQFQLFRYYLRGRHKS
ncbi:MAG TPA: Wzz/FepE/Etk N-terminal domain-containing protein [Candidatus Angelobacter sp.]